VQTQLITRNFLRYNLLQTVGIENNLTVATQLSIQIRGKRKSKGSFNLSQKWSWKNRKGWRI